ncbi:glycosyltransferase family 2 protein [Clostridiaceae bacterium]|nr:glycosyltransferase family 2 protein [Clostridiaceae bacterium]
MKDFLISVIIPTRNRQSYAEAAVKNILSLGSDIQIIVQDNSNDDSLYRRLKTLIDGDRLVYHYRKDKIAGIDNYNIAASYVTGEFFCAIGDDDTVLPSIVACAKWMKRNHVDAVRPSKQVFYFWPNPEKGARNAFLEIGHFTGKAKLYRPEEGVIELLKNGGQNYLKLPMVGSYHGLVKTKCMKEVRDLTGRFYGGLSPDMYSAVCLSLLPNIRFADIDYPISLPGICPESTSAASDLGRHIGKLETAPHFEGLQETYIWDERIPALYSVQTIWCETLFKAICAMHREELIELYFSREKLITAIYNENKNQRKLILESLSKNDRQLLKNNSENNTKSYRKFCSRFLYVMNFLLRKKYRKYNCKNIENASFYVQKWLNRKVYQKAWKKIDELQI